jgi:RHS repeat-associated protein
VSNVTAAGDTEILLRHTVRVMDGPRCVAIFHTWEKDETSREAPAGTRRARFQLADPLGSVAMEVDGDAWLISYEEYFPYGGTALIAGYVQAEVRLKDYRYSGKECDDSTGLYYYGARYYATWLGRWLKPDPAGDVDGLNRYAFVKGNPLRFVDPAGLASQSTTTSTSSTGGNKFRWQVKSNGSYAVPDQDVQDILGAFGHPVQSVVKEYDDLASRVGFDVGKNRKGALSSSTVADLEQVFEASLPLHFNFNEFLGDVWTNGLDGYNGSKSKIPLYSVMRSKTTVELREYEVGKGNLNDILREVSGRPPEVHHVLFKAVHPSYANQVTNLMLTQRSKRESEFGPGQHELMHMVATGNHSDKFRALLPQFTDVYTGWIQSKNSSTSMIVSDLV